MKTAEQWVGELLDKQLESNSDYINAVREIQADALRHAARIAYRNQSDSSGFDIITEANKLTQ